MSIEVRLRDVEPGDLEFFYEHQLDPEAARMAEFPSRDREAFFSHWQHKVLGNSTGRKQTILADGQIAGNMVAWWQEEKRTIGYWLGREFWGRGIATEALRLFLEQETERPLHADTAVQNVGSAQVLRKCGFRHVGQEKDGEAAFDLWELR